MTKLIPRPQINKERLLQTFNELVKIYSPSLKEGAVKDYCRAKFEALGCIVFEDNASEKIGSDGGNLIAVLPAKKFDEASGNLRISEYPESKRIVLSSHMDCVEPCEGIEPVLKDGIISSSGSTILGADDRSGLAPIIELIATLAESDIEHPQIIAIFSIAEEIGLKGARFLELPKYVEPFDGELCLVLDAEGAPGGITIGAPFHHVFSATFHGKAAHAGVCPEKGNNAIVMAAKAISNMEIGRLDAETTSNVGTIKADGAINVVADMCKLTGECRSLREERADEVRDAMHSAMENAALEFGGGVEIEWELEYPGFRYDEDSELVQKLLAIAKSIGADAKALTSGGGSDANVLAGYGLSPIAVSTGMENFHSTEEYIKLKDLEDTTSFVLEIVLSL